MLLWSLGTPTFKVIVFYFKHVHSRISSVKVDFSAHIFSFFPKNNHIFR